MSLTPKYYVIPHGIITEGGKTYSAFKMMISFDEFRNYTGSKLAMADWNKVAQEIDALTWHYKVQLTGSKNLLIKPNVAADASYKPVAFRAKSITGKVESSSKFMFGQRFTDTTGFKPSFSFLGTQAFFMPASGGAAASEPILAQLEKAPSAASLAGEEPDYTEILRSANRYARTQSKQLFAASSFEQGLNFKAVYASLLDEPLAAEIQYGLIREFWIEETELPQTEGKYPYAIIVESETEGDSGPIYRFEKKSVAGAVKYYNGLDKIYFKTDDFAAVRHELTDPYKKQLESEKGKGRLHPDGIYIIGVLKTTGNKLYDPFNEPGIKAFNALIRDCNGALFSLSLQNKELVFPNTGKLTIERESAHLTARSEIVTEKGDVRSNLLFAWRGDNLAVNRVPSKLDADDAAAMEEGQGKLSSKQDYCEEDQFVRERLLDKNEHLPESSQAQLLTNNKYEFFLRTVTPTHYYLPFKGELKADQLAKTLTFEDMAADINPLLAVDFKVQSIETIPIKSPSIVGKFKHKDVTSDVVDKPRHLVLNKIKGEASESRYIYPPMIKFEDFKMLRYLTVESLTATGEADITKDLFVTRCIQLQNKVEEDVPAVYLNALPIGYLGDPRGSHLYIVPSDMFTAAAITPAGIQAYAYTGNFPFFKKTFPTEIKAAVESGINIISFTASGAKGAQKYSKLADGVYNFNVYVTDKMLQGSNIADDLKKYNSTPVRISILNSPQKPQLSQNKFEVRRFPDSNRNFWYLDIPVTKESSTWNSIKYLEETKVLRLRHEGLSNRLQKYYADGGPRVELLNNEYPYEMFLEKEGNINAKEGLVPFIYPAEINLRFKVPAGLKGSGTFFRLQLNDEDVLEARFDDVKGAQLRLDDVTVTLNGNSVALRIDFIPAENRYTIYKDGQAWVKLDKYVNQNISIRDLEIAAEVLPYIQFDNTGDLQFERTNKYSFIVDQRDPYYRSKKVKLFGSSIFQAYFPNVETEYELGSVGTVAELTIPNNVQPDPPQLEAQVLFMHEKNLSWADPGSTNIKENKTESIVRLSLQTEFMKEGKNKLGIVIAKVGDTASEPDANVSRIGEDVTKLTAYDWSKTNLKDLMNFSGAKSMLKKYCPAGVTNFYKIGASVYEVLECDPYYNSRLKRWQVVLPFKFFQGSEVMFMKLVCIKIAPGHGLGTANGAAPSADNPLIDSTNTNLSILSDAVQFPVYTRKVIRATKTQTEGRSTVTIRVNTQSVYPDKIYFAMLCDDTPEDGLLNFTRPQDRDKFSSLVNFALFPLATNARGKVLAFRGRKDEEVVISLEACRSILVLECEIHDNAAVALPVQPSFTGDNPFFDMQGVRPINLMEFTL